MNYQTMRSLDLKIKRSHLNERTAVTEFGQFSVCVNKKGTAFLVDTNVADKIKNRSWAEDNGGYLCSRIGNELVRLHDYVMSLDNKERPHGYYVDHINHDKMDNRRKNLRFVSPAESSKNMPQRRDNKSGVTGVCKTKDGKYRAYITVNQKQISLGRHDTIEEAAEARAEAETRLGFKTRPGNVAFLCQLEYEDR